MAKEPADRNNAEATRKGIRKVNLQEIKGTLSKRGRESFSCPPLKEAFQEMLKNGEAFIWEDAVPSQEKDKRNSSKAMWRNRANSVFESLNSGKKISIQWTTEDEMVISLKG